MGAFTEHKRLLGIAQAANVPVTLAHEELAILLDALVEQETELADLERQLAAARERIAKVEDKSPPNQLLYEDFMETAVGDDWGKLIMGEEG